MPDKAGALYISEIEYDIVLPPIAFCTMDWLSGILRGDLLVTLASRIVTI